MSFTTIAALVPTQVITSAMLAGTVVSNVRLPDGSFALTVWTDDGGVCRVLDGSDPIEADAAPAPAPGVRTLPRVQDYLAERAVWAHEAHGRALVSLASAVGSDLADFRSGQGVFGVSAQRLVEVPALAAAARAAIDAAVASGVDPAALNASLTAVAQKV